MRPVEPRPAGAAAPAWRAPRARPPNPPPYGPRPTAERGRSGPPVWWPSLCPRLLPGPAGRPFPPPRRDPRGGVRCPSPATGRLLSRCPPAPPPPPAAPHLRRPVRWRRRGPGLRLRRRGVKPPRVGGPRPNTGRTAHLPARHRRSPPLRPPAGVGRLILRPPAPTAARVEPRARRRASLRRPPLPASAGLRPDRPPGGPDPATPHQARDGLHRVRIRHPVTRSGDSPSSGADVPVPAGPGRPARGGTACWARRPRPGPTAAPLLPPTSGRRWCVCSCSCRPGWRLSPTRCW